PDADAFGAGIFRPGIEIGQTEHVAELVADDADIAHLGAAFLDNEIRPAAALMGEERLVRPVESAAIGLHALAGVEEEDTVDVLDVGKLDADDGEAIGVFLPGVVARVPAETAAALAALALDRAAAVLGDEDDLDFPVLLFFLALDQQRERVAGLVLAQDIGEL